MPNWEIHKKWDSKLGIPPDISDYIQKAIDSKSSADKKIPMPEDFRQHTEERKIEWANHSNFSINDLNPKLHDRAKNKIIQKQDLQFLLIKGTDFIRAYYAHFILDYLNGTSIRQLLDRGTSVSECIDKYYKHKAVSLPETAEYLTSVMDFLKSHAQEIKEDLGI
jgi:hypothetical protein